MTNKTEEEKRKLIVEARNKLNEVLEESNKKLEDKKLKEFDDWKNKIPETIYPLQEKYARLLVQHIVDNPELKKYNFATGMQSGKSGFIGTAAKLLLVEDLGYKMIYVCSLSDKDYWAQCYKQFYHMELSSPQSDLMTQLEQSDLIIAKPSELKKHFSSRKKEKYIIFWDECHYGDGKSQGVDRNLLRRLHGEGHITVGVSATSFSIQQKGESAAVENEDDDAIIFAPTREELAECGYRGISSMVENKQLFNPDYDLKLRDGLNNSVRNAVRIAVTDYKLSHGDKRIMFFRLPPSGKHTKKVLKELKELVTAEFKGIADVRFQDVKKLSMLGFEIPRKGSVLVYHTKGGLRAGKRMETELAKTSLISHVSMVWESSNGHVAASSQGLPGRFCNYTDNRHIKIYCDDRLLNFYAEYEDANYDITQLGPEIFKKYGVRKLDSRTKPTISFTEKWGIDKLEKISLDDFNKKYEPHLKGTRLQTMWSSKGKSTHYHIANFEKWNNIFEEGNTSLEEGFEMFSRKGTHANGIKKVRIEEIELGFMVFDGDYSGNSEIKKGENVWNIDPNGFVLVFHRGKKVVYNSAGVKSDGSVFDRS